MYWEVFNIRFIILNFVCFLCKPISGQDCVEDNIEYIR